MKNASTAPAMTFKVYLCAVDGLGGVVAGQLCKPFDSLAVEHALARLKLHAEPVDLRSINPLLVARRLDAWAEPVAPSAAIRPDDRSLSALVAQRFADDLARAAWRTTPVECLPLGQWSPLPAPMRYDTFEAAVSDAVALMHKPAGPNKLQIVRASRDGLSLQRCAAG